MGPALRSTLTIHPVLTLASPLCAPPAAAVHEKLLSLFHKGGYEVVYPEGLSNRWAAPP